MMATVWVEHRRKPVLFCQDTEEAAGCPKKEVEEDTGVNETGYKTTAEDMFTGCYVHI